MDAALLSVLGTIVQAYASILGIIGMYLVFLRQRADDKKNEVKSRARVKSDSLVDFINREIAPAYANVPVIRVDSEKTEEVVNAVNHYWSDRKTETPHLGIDDVKRLVVLWAIAQREKEQLLQIKAEFKTIENKRTVPRSSALLFIGYFLFVLTFGFVCLFLVFMNSSLANSLTFWIILFSIAGAFPLGNLFYSIR
jgi:hypothetical protein